MSDYGHIGRRVALGVAASAVAFALGSRLAVAAEPKSLSEGKYMGFDLAELEAAVDPKVGTPNWRELFMAMQKMSGEAREANPPETYSYGPGPRDLIDLHRQNVPAGAATLIFFHGGGWRIGQKEDMTFMAPGLNEAGLNYLAPNYPLSPASPMGKTLPACVEIVLWVYRNAEQLGINRDRLFLGGASAGAHIAAYLLTLDWRRHGLPKSAFKGGVLLSGFYDLTPMKMLRSYDYLGLTASQVAPFSPVNHLSRIHVPLLVGWAENDPPVIRQQSLDFLTRAREEGIHVREEVEPGKNHFNFILSLGDSSSRLTRMVSELTASG